MLIGIPKEIRAGQTLVAATPNTVQKLISLGYTVSVEQGAGELANYFDQQFEEAGASLVSTAEVWAADIVVCLDAPSLEQLALMKEGATLLSRLDPQNNTELLEACAQRKITALALDAVPRISRAQSLDVRSSLMNVAGYRAVIEAANAFGRQFTGAVTAAGRVNPAKVYVIGVGVAGLAAIGTAGSMGAEVFATDVRSDVADQVQSLGATFVEIPVSQESTDGYARELDKDDQARTQEVYMHQASKSDIVITTAQVPGRPAPLLLTAEAVSTMMPGSVIVDMGASDLGSNCALTEPGKVITTENGVIIIGYTDLPARLPGQASQLFGQNIVNLLKLVTPDKNGQPVWNEDDVVIRGMLTTREGQIVWPPPPVQVSAAPSPGAATEKATQPGSGTQASASDSEPAQAVEAAASKRSLLLFANGGGRSRSERLRYCSSLQRPRTCRAISWSSCSRVWSASTLSRAFPIRSIPHSCRKRMRSQASSSLVPCCKLARAICSLRCSLSSRWPLLLSISSVASSLPDEC